MLDNKERKELMEIVDKEKDEKRELMKMRGKAREQW
jgi:hypothetical protein